MNPLDECQEPEKNQSQIVLIDCSLFVSDWVDSLIGPSALLLLVVSHLFAVSSFMGGVGKKPQLSELWEESNKQTRQIVFIYRLLAPCF